MKLDEDIMVSICIVTYNQKDYIAQCLESVINQKTDFNFEIIIGDDASSDCTRLIISKYTNKYPNLIKPIYHSNNIGASSNVLSVYNKAKGKYIAHLDGDDYFLPNKLQTQVDYLEKNPNCNIAFHKMNTLEKDEIREQYISNKILDKKYYRKDIIEFVAIGANSSKMFRKDFNRKKFFDFDVLDYTLHVLDVGNGYAAFCSNEPLGVYRKGIGVAGSDKANIAAYKTLKFFLEIYPEYSTEINSASWAYFLQSVKQNKPTKWLFFKLIMKNFSTKGLINYLFSRPFRKELSGLKNHNNTA